MENLIHFQRVYPRWFLQLHALETDRTRHAEAVVRTVLGRRATRTTRGRAESGAKARERRRGGRRSSHRQGDVGRRATGDVRVLERRRRRMSE